MKGPLVWDQTGERTYEAGVEKVVLYLQGENGAYPSGIAWNGCSAVNESPSGAEASPIYADNKKYLTLLSTEEFGATIEAYTYPDEFEECDGSKEIAPGVTIGQQARKVFGFCYKTLIGNDTEGTDHGYKITCVYGCLAAPSEKGHASINESMEPDTFSWEISTTAVEVPGFKPTATVVIKSTKVDAAKLKKLEDILYGSTIADARLPLPAEIITLIGTASVDG